MYRQPDLESYLQFLSNPLSFPEKTARVQLIQTHASVVALTDEYAYKMKKAVDFGFLDFSSLAQRQFYCQEELRLNQRLSEGIYLEVLPIYGAGNQLSFSAQAEAQIVNYVVKMKRLDEDRFLIHLIQEESFADENLNPLIERLGKFYQSQPVDTEIQLWGSVEKIQQSVEENFEQMQPFVPNILSSLAFQTLRDAQSDFLVEQSGQFEERVQANKILEGHGDIRAEHIYYEQANQVHLFDCIEFNERLRYLDPLNDIAFLAMDLDYRYRPDLAEYFTQAMRSYLEEQEEVRQLLDFYKCYRACVRGKVNGFKAQEKEVGAPAQEESLKKARRYFKLALRYALLGSSPTLVVVMGGVATGKSTMASALSEAWDAPHLNSDVVRKRLAGIPPKSPTPEALRDQVYSEEMTQRTYEALVTQGLDGISSQGLVVLDATFRYPPFLEMLQKRTREKGLKLILIQTYAPEEVIKARLQERDHKGNVSDMRIRQYDAKQHQPQYDLATVHPAYLKIDTTPSLEDTLTELFQNLRKLLK